MLSNNTTVINGMVRTKDSIGMKDGPNDVIDSRTKDVENGYIAFYKGKKMEVYADTSYHAQQKAAQAFGAKKSYEVTVVLAEKNGEQVVHKPMDSKTKDDYYSPTDQTIGNYNGYHIVFNGGFIRAQEDGFTKIEFPSSMGAGGWSRADVQKMFDKIDARRSGMNDEEPMTKADREKYLELVTKLLNQVKSRNASPNEIRTAEILVQRAKEKLAGMKDAEEIKGQVIISSQDMARYNELKAMGYVTLWTGEGKIAMAPRRTKDASSDEYIVNVGNVGNIVCASEQEALKTFNEYVRQSKSTSGRAAGEEVVLLKNGYPIKDFVGSRTLSGEDKMSVKDYDVDNPQGYYKAFLVFKQKDGTFVGVAGGSKPFTLEGKDLNELKMNINKYLASFDAMSVNEYQTKVQELRDQAKKAREEGNMARFNEIAKQIEDLTKEYNTKDEDLKEKLIRLAEEAGDKQYADDIRNGKVPLSQSELVRRIDWYTTRTVGE